MVGISVVGQGHCKDPKAVYSVFIFMLSWERSGEGREEQGEQIALAGVVQSEQRWEGRELRAKALAPVTGLVFHSPFLCTLLSK